MQIQGKNKLSSSHFKMLACRNTAKYIFKMWSDNNLSLNYNIFLHFNVYLKEMENTSATFYFILREKELDTCKAPGTFV